MRSEEWHSQTEQIALTKQRKHRAERAIKRGVKPDARGLVGSRGKAPAEYEAEPHSAQAEQAVQKSKRRKTN